MDVAVHHKRRQRLPSVSRPSVLGDGLLERARATSLGLLGITAAVGLAIVALVFNQGWPLVAGGPVPPLPPRHQGLGEATVAAGVGGDARSGADAGGSPRRQGAAGGEKARPDGTTAQSGGTSPVPSSEFVVSPSAPAKTEGDAPQGGSSPGQAPAKPKQPKQPSQPPTAQQAPSSSPPDDAGPEPPPATVSETPTASHVPSWSNGKGHAYGRSDDRDDHGSDDDDDDDDYDDDRDNSHGHGHDD